MTDSGDVQHELHRVVQALNNSLVEADHLINESEDVKYVITDFEIELSVEVDIADRPARRDGAEAVSPGPTTMVRLPRRSGPDDTGTMPLSESLYARIKLSLRRNR